VEVRRFSNGLAAGLPFDLFFLPGAKACRRKARDTTFRDGEYINFVVRGSGDHGTRQLLCE
jgi:hypothetical protein